MVQHKIVLCSGGVFFENEEDPILNHIISLTDPHKQNKKALFFPTAGHDGYSHDADVVSYFTRHGFSVNCLHLSNEPHTEEEIKELILSADLVYACGGNEQFLLETWRAHHADVYLKQAYENGTVLSGQSSGAMCWMRTAYDDCGENDAYIFLDALDLLPYVMCPHFEDWQCFLEDVKKQPLSAIAIDNDIAVSVVDGEYTIIDSGRNPRHSAFWMPAEENWAVHDIMRGPHLPIDWRMDGDEK